MSDCLTSAELHDVASQNSLPAHVRSCPTCRTALAQIGQIRSLGAEIRTGFDANEIRHLEEIRTAVTSRLRPKTQPRGPRRPVPWVAACLVAASGAMAGVLWALETPDSPTTNRGRILVNRDADFSWVRPLPDEQIRLRTGMLLIEVKPLGTAERFSVVTGDGSVEVRGTRFEVRAVEDSLTYVHVEEGLVDVFVAGERFRLKPGDDWARPPTARRAGDAVPPAQQPEPSPRRPERVKPIGPRPGGGLARNERTPQTCGATACPDPIRGPGWAAYDRGWQALRTGHPTQAAKQFAIAKGQFTSEPEAEDATYWFAVSLARTARLNNADTPAATAALAAFLQTYPESPRGSDVHVMLGWILYRANAVERARAHFQAASHSNTPKVRRSAEEGLRLTARPQFPSGDQVSP